MLKAQLLLEPHCCTMCPQKSTWSVTGLGNRGPLKSEGSKWCQIGPKWAWVTTLIIWDQLDIIQSLQRPLFSKPVTGQVLFFGHSTVKRL